MEHGLFKSVIAPDSIILRHFILKCGEAFPYTNAMVARLRSFLSFTTSRMTEVSFLVSSPLSFMPIEILHKRLLQGGLLSLGINTRRIDDLSTSPAPVSL
jgi:hypothetical protein